MDTRRSYSARARRRRDRRSGRVAFVTPGAPPGYDPARHNYARKLAAMSAAGRFDPPPGTVLLTEIRHDDWCAVFRGAYCDCSPSIELRAG